MRVVVAIIVALGFAFFVHMDFVAYRLRFPHAPAWTWLFSGK